MGYFSARPKKNSGRHLACRPLPNRGRGSEVTPAASPSPQQVSLFSGFPPNSWHTRPVFLGADVLRQPGRGDPVVDDDRIVPTRARLLPVGCAIPSAEGQFPGFMFGLVLMPIEGDL